MLYKEIQIGEKDYKLRLDTKNCIALEDKLGENPLNVLMKMSNADGLPSIKTLITILHYALQKYQHEITINDTYEIYDEFIEEGKTFMDLVTIMVDVFEVSGFFKKAEIEKEAPKNKAKKIKAVK